MAAMETEASVGTSLFDDIASINFLDFQFGGRSYSAQLLESTNKTKGQVCAIQVEVRTVGESNQTVVWCKHDFRFLGGSLGCAEGERITRAFEYATANHLPIVVECCTGGARMQEGTLSLMQMAKISVAVEAHRRNGLPFISLLKDPTYGGVSASYAMQADVRVAIGESRIGFAGPGVILNTMFEMDQAKYDAACPNEFQSAEYLLEHGQLDVVVVPEQGEGLDRAAATVAAVTDVISKLVGLLRPEAREVEVDTPELDAHLVPTQEEIDEKPDYTKSRLIKRYQAQDLIAACFTDYVELVGDGKTARDCCIKGGLAKFRGRPCVVIGSVKGHTPAAMQAANYGMAAPSGYRTALRLFKLAETFHLPVVTLVDTCGAWPSFDAERDGQSEAIATNLTAMAGLRVPIVTLVVGEGGSGGALGIGMGNKIGMFSQGYFGVISPEGAASILGRYKDDADKAARFPLDCQELATVQNIYAYQLKKIGVVDEIVYEREGETYESFPVTAARAASFIGRMLKNLLNMSADELVQQRYAKFRAMGSFSELSSEAKAALLEEADGNPPKKRVRTNVDTAPSKLVEWIANETLRGAHSRLNGLAPPLTPMDPPPVPEVTPNPHATVNAKSVLDAEGPEAMAQWVRAQTRVLYTDTTMRDAHQSLLATRVRTIDLVKGAAIASKLLPNAFSVECWGGATFDVCYRFLHEDPWERLAAIRAACPNICTQMLIRGANAVGYTSYPDNVVEEFVALAAKNMDVFRIFDCFNAPDQMKVCIDAVRKANKVAEVCICYTGDINTSTIYNVEYYRDLVGKIVDAGAHIIGIKDMAGLLKPQAAAPLMAVIREITDLPVHFHTHCTSSASLATAIEMTRAGCDIVDFATASMADLSSQPSLNAFCASMVGDPRDTGVDFMTLEPYDMYWMRVRDMYGPFENGMKSGTARVFDHEIPGGQYANLLVQCKSMGLGDRWEEVCDMYHDVNMLMGDVVKVTPSSKVVGDLALYLINLNLKASDILDPVKGDIDFPASVVDLMRGGLGFPHLGFPPALQQKILDKAGAVALTERPGLTLPAADLAAQKANLESKWGMEFDDERTISSLIYPKVFDDYLKFTKAHSMALTYLPTTVFYYGLSLGQTATIEQVPLALRSDLRVDTEGTAPFEDVAITLVRVGPVKKGMRTLVFKVGGTEQHVEVKEPGGEDEFDGPMADPSAGGEVASPMPGAVEKLLVKEGDEVTEGDVLAIVVAMKMEVEVKASMTGTVGSVHVVEGCKVVEGALLAKLEGKMTLTKSAENLASVQCA